ncbi:MAG: pentapeptide repeat-containing protein [Planctomycetota bacterium]|jgi:uncharacterized protein YjbI with pentapeptide repeats
MPEDQAVAEQQECRFSQEQYDMLMRCSEKKDMTEWNEWHTKKTLMSGDEFMAIHNIDYEPTFLDNAELQHQWLEGADFTHASLRGARLEGARLSKAKFDCADLEGAHFNSADLKGASFSHAKMRRTVLTHANIGRAIFDHNDMERANFVVAALDGSSFYDAHLKGARFLGARLEGASFLEADITAANFDRARLHRVSFLRSRMEQARLAGAIVDGETYLWECSTDKETDFTGVGLRSARVEPRLRSRLEGNIRRSMWRQWYSVNGERSRLLKLGWWFLTLPVRAFWWISDYGESTGRVVGIFLLFAALFAVIYGLVPGLVTDLHGVEVLGEDGRYQTEVVSSRVLPFRAFYFSVVTMTTLGFGDMYAAPGSVTGHLLLTLHVILGYVLLGALVTRLAILFQES